MYRFGTLNPEDLANLLGKLRSRNERAELRQRLTGLFLASSVGKSIL
jgi:hypothetical protein